MNRPRSSRQRYDVFRRYYRNGTLDDRVAGSDQQPKEPSAARNAATTSRAIGRDTLATFGRRRRDNGLLQTAIVSPSISVIRLLIAVTVCSC